MAIIQKCNKSTQPQKIPLWWSRQKDPGRLVLRTSLHDIWQDVAISNAMASIPTNPINAKTQTWRKLTLYEDMT